jgi:hypothetical protein
MLQSRRRSIPVGTHMRAVYCYFSFELHRHSALCEQKCVMSGVQCVITTVLPDHSGVRLVWLILHQTSIKYMVSFWKK